MKNAGVLKRRQQGDWLLEITYDMNSVKTKTRACFCCCYKIAIFILLMKQWRILSHLWKSCKCKSVCGDKKQNQIIKNHEIWNNCAVGFGLDGEAALKLLILAKLTLKESKMLLGFLPAILWWMGNPLHTSREYIVYKTTPRKAAIKIHPS